MFTSNIQLDQRDVDDFCKSLDAYADTRQEKSYHYIINRVGKDVAARAAQFTHHADDAKLRAMFGQPAREMNPKTGRLRKGKVKHTNDAGAILAKRMARAGKNARSYTSADWHETVRKFVARTLSSINFMRAGWLPAFNTLSLSAKVTSGISRGAAFGRTQIDVRKFPKNSYPEIGGAIPARDMGDGTIACEIWNAAVNPRSKTSWSGGLGKYGVMGLEKALAFKSDDMAQWVEQEQDKRAQKVGL